MQVKTETPQTAPPKKPTVCVDLEAGHFYRAISALPSFERDTKEIVCHRVAKIRARKITYYTQFETTRKNVRDKSKENLKDNRSKGFLSHTRKKQFQEMVENWAGAMASTSRRVRVLTLTLPEKQKHSDKYIKRHILYQFIQNINRKMAKVNFAWKAEAQNNGNIHFHCFIDRFIWKDTVRDMWNEVLELHGYNTTTTNGNPAPTSRIEAIKNIESAAAYAAKYYSKDDKYKKVNGQVVKDDKGDPVPKRLIEGRIAEMSDTLRELPKLGAMSEMFDPDEFEECLRISDISGRNVAIYEEKETDFGQSEVCSRAIVSMFDVHLAHLSPYLKKMINSHHSKVRKFIYDAYPPQKLALSRCLSDSLLDEKTNFGVPTFCPPAHQPQLGRQSTLEFS